jgi:formate dehydrogenase maturation protein FdhE
MRESWDRRVGRAEELAAENSPAAPLLGFYARLLKLQKDLYDSFTDLRPSGRLDRDVAFVRNAASTILHAVAESGPEQLVIEARRVQQGARSAIDDMLLTYWRAPSDRQFFAKAILQPYGQWLADAGATPVDRALPRRDNRCPHCGGTPQLSILESAGGSLADGGGRQLLCATCLTPWSFRRVRCPYCGEGDERKLGYFQSPPFDHLRVDACDNCHHYVKTVDLGRLGLAVPLVDEVAGAPLDLWAREHGYEKIELNLVGL